MHTKLQAVHGSDDALCISAAALFDQCAHSVPLCSALSPLQTFPLSITADGKKVTGRIDSEEVEFELFDSTDPDKSLQMLLGF